MSNPMVYSYRRWRYKAKPLPVISVEARPLCPGWLIRLVAAACTGTCVGLAANPTLPSPLMWTLVTASCAWMLVYPGSGAAMTTLLFAGLALLLAPHAPFNPAAPWILLTGYLSLRWSMVCALIGWKGKAEVRALLTWPDAVILALTVLFGCAVLVPGSGDWVAVTGTVALLAIAAILTLVGARKR